MRPYVEAFAASLRPVFLAAAGISFLAFALTWLLREVPLRDKTRFEAAADAIPAPTAPTEPTEAVGAPSR